jgi:hypothetical protein
MGLLTADPYGFDLSRHCELSPCQKHHDSGSLTESAITQAAPAIARQTPLGPPPARGDEPSDTIAASIPLVVLPSCIGIDSSSFAELAFATRAMR